MADKDVLYMIIAMFQMSCCYAAVTVSNLQTTEKTFEGTIFVSSAAIGIAIGLCSILTVICLLCVVCRLRRGSRHEEKWYPQPEKSNTVIPTIQLKQHPQLPWERPQYIP